MSKGKKSLGLCVRSLLNISTLNFCGASDTDLLLFNLFNLSQCKPKEKQPPAKMTAQIVEAHLCVDNHWDLLLDLGEGWNSNGWMEQDIAFY